MAIAQAPQVITGRKMRVDTTVVETNIHYPTDSSLLGDGVRVLTRLMKRATAVAGATGTRLRRPDAERKYRLLEIGRATRTKGAPAKEKLQGLYRKLLATTGRVVGQATRFAAEIAQGVKRSADVLQQAALDGLKAEREQMLPRVRQVMRQTRARVLGGDTRVPDKLVSLFEPTIEIIRKGKASKPTEFGKLVKIQEAEQQIIVDYEVYATRPSDPELLLTTAPEGRSPAHLCGAVRPAAHVSDAGVLPTGFVNSCSAGWSPTTRFMADDGAEVADGDRRVCAAVRHLEERAGDSAEWEGRPRWC